MTTIPDTPTTHDDDARAFLADLQRLMGSVRGLTLLTTDGRRKTMSGANVDEDFLREMALLIDTHPTIANASGLTSAEIRDHLSYYGSYHSVGEELTLNGRKIGDTLRAERGSIGQRALIALRIARSINTPAERESLVPHLEAISRDYSRGRRKRAKKPEDPAVAAAKKKAKEVKP